jgi:UDP-glucose 4-epimerase
VASSAAATEVGWRPEKTDLLTIVADAWRFAQERLPV